MTQIVTGTCHECQCELSASVVMPCFNAAADLEDQLSALAEQDTPGPWELIISDNGSRDGSTEIAKRFDSAFHRLVLLDSSTRPGAAHARNAGAAAARAANLVFCDADDVVDRYWLHELLRALDENAYVAGRIELDRLNKNVPKYGRRGGIQETGVPLFFGAPYVLTCNMGIRRDVFVEIGAFDAERFSAAAGEDVDFAIRARRRGVLPVFASAAVVHYRIRQSRRKALAQARSYGVTTAELLMHYDELPFPTAADDIRRYWSLGVRSLREWMAGLGEAPSWYLNYELAKTHRLLTDVRYWSLRRNFPRGQRSSAIRGQAMRRGLLRLATRLQVDEPAHEGDPDSLTYSALLDAQRRLDTEHRHLLGLGLLADANLTLDLPRVPFRWHAHAYADSIVSGLIEHGNYSGSEFAPVIAFVKECRPECAHAINVGANIGTAAIPLCAAGWDVLAIEPVRRAADLLRCNAAENGFEERITVVDCAVAEQAGHVPMVIGDNLSISELVGSSNPRELSSIGDFRASVRDVRAEPLQDILDKAGIRGGSVALVWSDTEGSEAAVIATGALLWELGVPLWVEIRPHALANHVRITDFCALVQQNFEWFSTLDDLKSGERHATAEMRRFIDELGRDRWTFANVMLHNRLTVVRSEVGDAQ
jgi:FkbM family methyltransferase